MSQLKELREKRASIHSQVVESLKQPQSVEMRSKVDAMLADIEAIGGDIARIERAEKIQAELEGRATSQPSTQPDVETRALVAASYRSAFFDYLQHGAPGFKSRGCSPESHLRLNSVSKEMAVVEKRDQIAGTQSITYTEGTTGGYFVPAGFVYDVEKATKYFAPLLDGSVIRTLQTSTGAVLPFPTSNDTQQAWQLLGEAQQVLENNTGTGTWRANYPTAGSAPSGVPGDVLMGSIPLGAYKGTTGIIRVSLELLQDSAFSLEAFLTEAFAVRLGRGYEYYLTNGTGEGEPTGILPAIAASNAVPVTAVGATNYGAASGNTAENSVGYQDLVSLIHSVDPSYRKGGKFMMHDTTVANLKKQLDAFGRPLWVPAVKDGEPDTLCGYPYVINQSFPQIAASATTVAFGQWSKFIVRKVKDLQVVRLDERFADFGEVGFVGFSRIDSNLIDAGTHPLNVLVQHS
jgi:HK97 family phage major capsid protein